MALIFNPHLSMQVDLEGNFLDFLHGLPIKLKTKFILLSNLSKKLLCTGFSDIFRKHYHQRLYCCDTFLLAKNASKNAILCPHSVEELYPQTTNKSPAKSLSMGNIAYLISKQKTLCSCLIFNSHIIMNIFLARNAVCCAEVKSQCLKMLVFLYQKSPENDFQKSSNSCILIFVFLVCNLRILA